MTSTDRSCRRVIAIGLGAVVTSASWAAGRAPALVAALLALSLAAWLMVSATLWRTRRLLDSQAAGLGVATTLTLLRGLLVSVAVGFAPVAPVDEASWVRWAPAVLYATAAILDRLDGIVARRLGQVTALGARLDEAMDALGLLAAPLVAVWWGRLPPWYLLLGAAYYLFHGGLWLRRRLDLPLYPETVRRRQSNRIFAGLQMTLVSVALAPLVPLERITVPATLLMMPPLLFFARDWLMVIGWLPSRAAPLAAARR